MTSLKGFSLAEREVLTFPSAKAAITLPRVDKDLLILLASSNT